MELSFQKIAHFRRVVPIKEQTVISYILDAARDGFEMNWNRFCKEVGLTLDIASWIRLAIAKVGSRDKLKVTYEMIKTFLTIEDLGLSEQTFGKVPTDGVPARTAQSPKSCSHGSEVGENGNQEDCVLVAGAFDASPSTKRGQTDGTLVSADEPVKKLQKIDGQGRESTGTIDATEDAILELVVSRDRVPLEDVVKHFNGSKRESVVELLDSLECNFLVYRKNGYYVIL